MTQKQPNLKLVIEIEYTVITQRVDMEDEDPDDIYMVRVGKPRVVVAKTKHVNVYSVDSAKRTILNLKDELETKLWNGLENQVGSNWAIDRITNLFANTHTLYVNKGSSYIPTPARWAAPKRGLINIRNTDHKCFKYCMLYHQSAQEKEGRQTTALDKIEDKHDYGAMTFPASLDDVQQFEEDNQITINIFKIQGADEILTLQDGNVEHCRHGMVNLLFVDDGEQAHYIYIKKLEHLMRASTHKGYQDRRYCPYCRTGVWCKDETFEEHLMRKHYSTKNYSNLELPEPGATMKFQNLPRHVNKTLYSICRFRNIPSSNPQRRRQDTQACAEQCCLSFHLHPRRHQKRIPPLHRGRLCDTVDIKITRTSGAVCGGNANEPRDDNFKGRQETT
jgi:hypothetical protein